MHLDRFINENHSKLAQPYLENAHVNQVAGSLSQSQLTGKITNSRKSKLTARQRQILENQNSKFKQLIASNQKAQHDPAPKPDPAENVIDEAILDKV